jgi:hypothetical protein
VTHLAFLAVVHQAASSGALHVVRHC